MKRQSSLKRQNSLFASGIFQTPLAMSRSNSESEHSAKNSVNSDNASIILPSDSKHSATGSITSNRSVPRVSETKNNSQNAAAKSEKDSEMKSRTATPDSLHSCITNSDSKPAMTARERLNSMKSHLSGTLSRTNSITSSKSVSIERKGLRSRQESKDSDGGVKSSKLPRQESLISHLTKQDSLYREDLSVSINSDKNKPSLGSDKSIQSELNAANTSSQRNNNLQNQNIISRSRTISDADSERSSICVQSIAKSEVADDFPEESVSMKGNPAPEESVVVYESYVLKT